MKTENLLVIGGIALAGYVLFKRGIGQAPTVVNTGTAGFIPGLSDIAARLSRTAEQTKQTNDNTAQIIAAAGTGIKGIGDAFKWLFDKKPAAPAAPANDPSYGFSNGVGYGDTYNPYYGGFDNYGNFYGGSSGLYPSI